MQLICLGDSLTWGPGVARNETWVRRLAAATGWDLRNAGLAGDTTGGMLLRLREFIGHPPDAIILLGGSNDVFASGEDSRARENLFAMVHQCFAAGVQPIVGIPIPPCTEAISDPWTGWTDFDAAAATLAGYGLWLRRLAAMYKLPVLGFDTLFTPPDPALYLDGLHPTGEGHRRMAELAAAILTRLH